MDDGWIKLHRSALDCDQFKDDWLWRLWCWCLLKANHQEGNFKGSVVPRGSFITGKLRAAEELGVTESKWWRGVDRLSKPPYGCLHVSANNRWTMITVCEYETYQQSVAVFEHVSNNQRTTSEQPAKPIEEQQEQLSLSQARGQIKVPVSWDSPEFWSLISSYRDHWLRGKGRKLDDIALQLQLKNIGAFTLDKVCRSLEKAIRTDKYALYDPDEVHPAFAKPSKGTKLKRLN